MSESKVSVIQGENNQDEGDGKETSEGNLLELFFLTRACNMGMLKSHEWLDKAYEWAKKIIENAEKQNKDVV